MKVAVVIINNDELYKIIEYTASSDNLAAQFSIIADAIVNTNNLCRNNTDKNYFFGQIFETAFTLIPEAQKGSFFELQEGIYNPIFCKGYDFHLLSQLTFSKDDFFIGFEEAVTSKTCDAYQVYIPKREDKKFSEKQINLFKQLGTYSGFASLYAPIKLDDHIIGLICVDNFNKKIFSETSRLILKIYAQLISNFYSIIVNQEREKRRYQEIIDALVSAIEIKDEYTVGHAKRVSEISIEVAKAMGIPADRFKTIETAAVLHDIGKIGTPSQILNKKSSLTKDEYEIVKRHPIDAKKILEKVESFDEILDLTYMHHEHYDGSGYPLGLSGENIPIEAQIIQASDAFDAMTSKRAYRDALNIETVMNIFREQRGKQFHPNVADTIIDLFNK